MKYNKYYFCFLNINGEFIFKDYPEFTPNLSPRDISKKGLLKK